MSIRRLGALAALLMTVAACGTVTAPGSNTGSGGELGGTDWILSSYDVGGNLTIVPDGVFADARFDGPLLAGFGGCNDFRSTYVSGARLIRISTPSLTQMACDETTMGVEQRYLSLLADARFFDVRLGQLTIYDGDGSRGPALVFDAAPRNPLLGTWRIASYATPTGSVAAVTGPAPLTVTFRLRNVNGSTGCNTFSATYLTNGDLVHIGQIATTARVCDDAVSGQSVMDQETAVLAALGGVAKIEARGDQLNLTDLQGHLQLALLRPAAWPSPSVSPGASAAAPASPSASASPTATPAPTKSPTPAPTAKPTAAPTAAPTNPPSTGPSIAPSPSIPGSLPPTAACELSPAGGPVVATITYPGNWSTVTEPPTLACRYFDPAPITVPADPATLNTAVRADVTATPYADAVTAATDPAVWQVSAKTETTAGGTTVTCIAASALADTAGIPAGGLRNACLADVGTAGTVTIWAIGTAEDAEFATRAAVVELMTAASTFTPTK